MSKNVLKGLSVIVGVLFLFGCTSTKRVEVRPYIEVKDRTDQEMTEGNAGFLAGTPQPEDRSNIRKTRKIYVLEVSQDSEGESEDTSVVESSDSYSDNSGFDSRDSSYNSSSDLDTLDFSDNDSDTTMNFADIDDDTSSSYSSSSGSSQTYTIQKDDTLQKISKKFYNSFSKWPKIYEVNKDVIEDPDRVKPGTVIQIPAL